MSNQQPFCSNCLNVLVYSCQHFCVETGAFQTIVGDVQYLHLLRSMCSLDFKNYLCLYVVPSTKSTHQPFSIRNSVCIVRIMVFDHASSAASSSAASSSSSAGSTSVSASTGSSSASLAAETSIKSPPPFSS